MRTFETKHFLLLINKTIDKHIKEEDHNPEIYTVIMIAIINGNPQIYLKHKRGAEYWYYRGSRCPDFIQDAFFMRTHNKGNPWDNGRLKWEIIFDYTSSGIKFTGYLHFPYDKNTKS